MKLYRGTLNDDRLSQILLANRTEGRLRIVLRVCRTEKNAYHGAHAKCRKPTHTPNPKGLVAHETQRGRTCGSSATSCWLYLTRIPNFSELKFVPEIEKAALFYLASRRADGHSERILGVGKKVRKFWEAIKGNVYFWLISVIASSVFGSAFVTSLWNRIQEYRGRAVPDSKGIFILCLLISCLLVLSWITAQRQIRLRLLSPPPITQFAPSHVESLPSAPPAKVQVLPPQPVESPLPAPVDLRGDILEIYFNDPNFEQLPTLRPLCILCKVAIVNHGVDLALNFDLAQFLSRILSNPVGMDAVPEKLFQPTLRISFYERRVIEFVPTGSVFSEQVKGDVCQPCNPVRLAEFDQTLSVLRVVIESFVAQVLSLLGAQEFCRRFLHRNTLLARFRRVGLAFVSESGF